MIEIEENVRVYGLDEREVSQLGMELEREGLRYRFSDDRTLKYIEDEKGLVLGINPLAETFFGSMYVSLDPVLNKIFSESKVNVIVEACTEKRK